VSHFATAAYGAAAVGAVLAGLFVAVAAADRALEDPHGMAYRETALLATGTLAAATLFSLLGLDWLAARLESVPLAVAVTLVGVPLAALVAGAVLTPPVHWYLRWARTPAVLRETDHDGRQKR
jgi:hypothetical protein